MGNIDLTCSIEDNRVIGNIFTSETRWCSYYREIYRKYREKHGGFNLAFPPGATVRLESDYKIRRPLIEGEELSVTDFYCGTGNSDALDSSEVTFYVTVFGKIDGAYALPSEQNNIYMYKYELGVDITKYRTTSQFPIEYNYIYTKMIYNKRFFTCTTPILSTLLNCKKLALQTLVPKETEGFKELATFDNFTQSCIFPIIRNVLIECLPVDKQATPSELNPLAENPSFGTW